MSIRTPDNQIQKIASALNLHNLKFYLWTAGLLHEADLPVHLFPGDAVCPDGLIQHVAVPVADLSSGKLTTGGLENYNRGTIVILKQVCYANEECGSRMMKTVFC